MRVSTTEAPVLRACIELLTLAKVLHWRTQSTPAVTPGGAFRKFSGRRGVADIIAVLPFDICGDVLGMDKPLRIGRLLAIEAKSPTGRQSPAQRQFQRDVEEAGGLYVLVRDVRELESLLRKEGVL